MAKLWRRTALNSDTASPSELAASVRTLVVDKYADGTSVSLTDAVPVEEPLEIKLAFDRGPLRTVRNVAVTMRTPGHDPELAVGFLVTEGIVRSRKQIAGIGQPAPNVIQIELASGFTPDLRALERNFYTTSSCGVCGKASLAAVRAVSATPLPPGRPQLHATLVPGLPDRLRAAQTVFEHTGGLHAAGLFAADGRLVIAREDVGRHNAVDKLVGERVLAGALPLHNAILVLSGRASFELVQKALMAGIPMIAAVGAPSSLAVALAAEFGLSLLGFVRPGRFNVYTGGERIVTREA